jgi:hypothetical protein
MGKSDSKPKTKVPATKPAKAAARSAQLKADTKAKRKPGPKPGSNEKAPKVERKAGAGKSARKSKTIHDSFNMPAEDYALLQELKKRALAAAMDVKKSQLLRAGIRMLASLSDEVFKLAISAVPAGRKGRPAKKLES